MREDWLVVVEDLYGGFELVTWHEREDDAVSLFEEWVGEEGEFQEYPDRKGRDAILLKVVRRGDDTWQEYLQSLRKTANNAPEVTSRTVGEGDACLE